MAEFNRCAHLASGIKEGRNTYSDIRRLGGCPFDYLLDLQNNLQVNLEKQYPGRTISPLNLKTKGELVDFIMDQKRAIDDEFQELIHSIAGTNKSEKEQTSIWKKWKSNYDSLRAEDIDEGLTEDEQLEKEFEVIDIMHFMNNILLAMGIDEARLFELYYVKNIENIRRYDNNY